MKKSNSKTTKNANKVTALYLRISTADRDRDESYSIGNQRHLLHDVALRLNLTNIREYIDDGVSGTVRDRKQFEQLQVDIVKGEISVVMVKDLSRLARDHIKADTLIEEFFPEHDVRLIAPGDGVDTANGEDDVLLYRRCYQHPLYFLC